MPLPTGWIVAVRSPVVNFLAPEPQVIRYTDEFRFGLVEEIRSLTVGEPEVINNSGFRIIDLELRVRGVHDVVLIDRIS